MAKHKHLRAALARARSGAASAAHGAKGSAISAVVGAAAQFGYSMASDKVEFIRNNWYAGPAAMAIAGHFLKRKHHDAGTALLGVAGYVGAWNYRQSQSPPPAQPGAKGFDQLDAGALDSAFAALNPGDAGALDGGDAGALVYDQLAGSAAPSLDSAQAAGLQMRQAMEAMGLEDASGIEDAGYLEALRAPSSHGSTRPGGPRKTAAPGAGR